MGLDNIPHEYPCVRAGTAVQTKNERFDGDLTHGPEFIVDCSATRELGPAACPHLAWRERVAPGEGTLGMFGTPCWWRGKVGTYMLGRISMKAEIPAHLSHGFYGTVNQEQPGPHLPPEYCTELASWMADHTELYAMACSEDPSLSTEVYDLDKQATVTRTRAEAVEDQVREWRYAVEWLRFVAAEAGGADAWY